MCVLKSRATIQSKLNIFVVSLDVLDVAAVQV
jgi:hypothetical protein